LGHDAATLAALARVGPADQVAVEALVRSVAGQLGVDLLEAS
jgi:hypothetical protein